jgi:hypothetical protein
MAKIFGSAGASPSLSEHPRSVLTKIAGFASPVKTKPFLFRENFLSPPAPFAFPPSTFRRPLAYFSSTFRLLVFYLSFTLAQPKGGRVLTRQVRCDDGHFRAFLLHKFASAIILTCAWKKQFSRSRLSCAPKVFERVVGAFRQACHLPLWDVQQQAPEVGGAFGYASALADDLTDGVVAESPSHPSDGFLITELQNPLYDELPILADVQPLCVHIPKVAV